MTAASSVQKADSTPVGSATHPIKIGVLFDTIFATPPPPWHPRNDTLDAYRLTFDDAYAARMFDRPVEIVLREVEGLPRGSVKEVIDAYKSLVDEGCLAVLGPMISDNAVALAEYVNEIGRVPAISWAGTDDWLGEWTFSLSNGSLPDEPTILANIMAHAGLRKVGVVAETSVVGDQYLAYFRDAARSEGLEVVATAQIAATVGDPRKDAAPLAPLLQAMRAAGADSVLYLGFGYGSFVTNAALAQIDWHPPRYTTAAWEVGFMHEAALKSYAGWIGLEQYDEENPVAVAFLDRFEQRYGRRPEYFVPGLAYDFANVICRALAKASPLSARGVKNALERVRLIPAASGAPGTRISFGRYTRRGWMGAGYLVAREFDPQNSAKTIFRGRIQAPLSR